ncbi:GNAT family N-acetyltransferase [Amycolatopsis sp. NPDC051758]|uniref:GNAT family N-acetyltransferase n=1 Tax=Amycolatopsis sp. NPDC051758 TaxID=3363935 RepID=UPI0037A57326
MVGQLGHPSPVKLLRLGVADAGEVLTLQRAAYVTEARAHDDFDLPPLLETLPETRAALSSDLSWGFREHGRLVASVRLSVSGDVGVVGRLVVAPDRQGHGLGRELLLATEAAAPPAVTVFRLFTGSKSVGPQAMYLKLGYRETHRTPEHGHELVHFEKARVQPS